MSAVRTRKIPDAPDASTPQPSGDVVRVRLRDPALRGVCVRGLHLTGEWTVLDLSVVSETDLGELASEPMVELDRGTQAAG